MNTIFHPYLDMCSMDDLVLFSTSSICDIFILFKTLTYFMVSLSLLVIGNDSIYETSRTKSDGFSSHSYRVNSLSFSPSLFDVEIMRLKRLVWHFRGMIY